MLDSDGRPLRVGDRVVPAANVPCGRCWYCLTGQPYYLCEHIEDYGNSLGCAEPPHLFGGWSEQMYLLPGTRAVPGARTRCRTRLAVLTEPLAVTHGIDTRAVASASAPFGESVVVFGVGPLGLCHLIKARLVGCGRLVAIDLLPVAAGARGGARRDARAARRRARAGRARRAVRGHTDGRGADLVIDCERRARRRSPYACGWSGTGGVVIEAGAFVDLGPVGVNPTADICTRNVTVLGIGGELLSAYAPALELLAQASSVCRSTGRYPSPAAVGRRRTRSSCAQRDGAMKVVLGGR